MAVIPIGDGAVQIIYKTPEGTIKERLLAAADERGIDSATVERPWAFDGDGESFKLAVEAKRIDVAFLFDPMMAVHTSNVEPLPHQITAVYESMLPRQPLRFTIELLWEEYREQHPDGYSYSRFCKLYRTWKKRHDVVMRQEHRPGEKLFLDWAGATIPIHQSDGGTRAAALFVSALCVSSYTYAEAVDDQQMNNWLKVQRNAFEFFGGCPKLLIPDNTKTGVTRACLYEPDLNPTYQEFATHYKVAVMPTRPRKPRDKAKVESAVQVVQRWIVMRLRRRRFFSVAQRSYRRTAHLSQQPAVPQTQGRKPRQPVRKDRQARTTSAACVPLRSEPMGTGPSEHRLPCGVRW